jgi:uroporphyrinogen decarboxylase
MKQADKNIKNDLLLKALRGDKVERPPVWMMRQAGRYLPDFMKLKEKYSFFERVETPELATEITIMPIYQVGVDAAILFSDILVIPQAMGMEVLMTPGKGPELPGHIKSPEQVMTFEPVDVKDRLHYVFDAIRMTKDALNDEVPLIGFAGAPWTIFCYMVQGAGSKGFEKAKAFCFKHPEAAKTLLEKITDVTIDYLRQKVAAGVNAIQIFDSWGGILSPEMYNSFSMPYFQRIIDALKDETYVIAYPKGCWYALDDFSVSGADALGIDWTVSPSKLRSSLKSEITLQGNLDPCTLYAPIPEIEKATRKMVDEFGFQHYIANLGHGILPDIPVDHARAFVNTIKSL